MGGFFLGGAAHTEEAGKDRIVALLLLIPQTSPAPPRPPPVKKTAQVSNWFTNWRARRWKPSVQGLKDAMAAAAAAAAAAAGGAGGASS